MRATIFYLVLAVGIVAGILVLLRSRRLREKYAALWIVVGVASIVLAAWPALLAKAATLVGVQVGSNLLFAFAIILLLGVCLQLSLEVSTQEEKIRRLAEEAAIARAQIKALEQARVLRLPRDECDEPGPDAE